MRSRLALAALEARKTRSGTSVHRQTVKALQSHLAGQGTPAAWQVDPKALAPYVALARQRLRGLGYRHLPFGYRRLPFGTVARLGGFGALGLSPTATTVVSTVGAKAGAVAASSIATAAGAGAVAGPIGVAAGVVIALAASLFEKNYFNVADSNAACQQLESLWSQYKNIQGHVSGRSLGFSTMNHLMHAATGAGLFPGNDQHLSFHEGTLICAGDGAWVDSFTGETNQGAAASCGAGNCLPNAYQKFAQNVGAAGSTPPAVYLVDSILLPMNSPQNAQIPWVYNGVYSGPDGAAVHQLLYDLADAYLGENMPSSAAYVKYPAVTATPAVTPKPAATPSAPVVAAVTAASPKSTPVTPTPTPVPAFPGFDETISGTDQRLSSVWTESESGWTGTWTPIGNGFFNATWTTPGQSPVSAQIQIVITGNTAYILRQDQADGSWQKYQGTFGATGLTISGQKVDYWSGAPQGAVGSWSASIAPPAASVAATPALAPGGNTAPPVATVSTVPTLSQTASTAPSAAAAQPLNVTVSTPAGTSDNTTLIVGAILGGALLLGLMMSQKKR